MEQYYKTNMEHIEDTVIYFNSLLYLYLIKNVVGHNCTTFLSISCWSKLINSIVSNKILNCDLKLCLGVSIGALQCSKNASLYILQKIPTKNRHL